MNSSLPELKRRFADRLLRLFPRLPPRLYEAFATVPRHLFAEDSGFELESIYTPENLVPLTRQSSISQPQVVAAMLSKLDPQEGQRLLEIGAASGYTVALEAACVGPAGKVFSVEWDEKLLKKTQARFAHEKNIFLRAGDGFYGWPEEAPFHGMSGGLAFPQIPQPLLGQLHDGGRLVVPLELGALALLFSGARQGGTVRGYFEPYALYFVPLQGEHRVTSPGWQPLSLPRLRHALEETPIVTRPEFDSSDTEALMGLLLLMAHAACRLLELKDTRGSWVGWALDEKNFAFIGSANRLALAGSEDFQRCFEGLVSRWVEARKPRPQDFEVEMPLEHPKGAEGFWPFELSLKLKQHSARR